MAIVEDGSSPAVATAVGTNVVITSASFTPPANSLVVVMYGFGWGSTTTTAVLSSSPSTTWTVANSQNGNTLSRGFAGIAYHYFASSPGAMTVTATPTNGNGAQLAIKVLTGASSTPGANAGRVVGAVTPGETAFTHSITTTTAGGHVYGLVDDSGNSNTHTAVDAATTIINNYNNPSPGDQITLVSFKATSDVVTPGATTFGTTSNFQSGGHIVLMEVVPAAATTPQLVMVNDQALVRASRW